MGGSRIGHHRAWRMALVMRALLCVGAVNGCCVWWPLQQPPGAKRITLQDRRPAPQAAPAARGTSAGLTTRPAVPHGTPRMMASQPSPSLPPLRPLKLSRRQKKRMKDLDIVWFDETPSRQPASVTVKGWLSGQPGQQWLRLRLTNRTSSMVQMSYIADRYIIETRDERMAALAKEHFLRYPSALFPGEECEVVLRLPSDVAAGTITRLTITLDAGNTVIVVTPMGMPAAAAARPAAPPPTPTP